MKIDPHIGQLFSTEEGPCASLEEMQAYASGKLLPMEMHAFERHLLNCELCSIAYEGLAGMSPDEAVASVEAIKQRAWDRVVMREKRKRRGVYFWISGAAAILLLIVASYFIAERPGNKDDLQTLAETMLEPPAEIASEVERYAGGEKVVPEGYKENTEADRELLSGNFGSSGNIKKDIPGRKRIDASSSSNASFVDSVAPFGDFAPLLAMEEEKNTDYGALEMAEDEMGAGEMVGDEMADGEFGFVYEDNLSHDEANETVVYLDEGTVSKVPTMKKAPVEGKVQAMKKAPVKEKTSDKGQVPAKVEMTSDAITKEFKDPGKSNYEQGVEQFQRRQYQDAAANFRQASAHNPADMDAHLLAARSFLQLNQPNAAVYHLDRILSVRNNSLEEDAKWYKSIAMLQLGKKRHAKDLLKDIKRSGGNRSKAAEMALDKL